MKKLMAFNLFFTAIILLLFGTSHATDGVWVDKQKQINRSITLKNNQQVSITNSFGKVNVNNWSRNEVKVEITIKVSAVNDKLAQELLDRIQIIENIGAAISFETKTGAVKNVSKQSKMEIDYVVTLPSQTPLYVKNSFGDTFIPDRKGATEILQSFGGLKAGNLYRDAVIKVEFGKLIADGIDGSKIKSSYSEVDVKKLSGDLKASFEFCAKLQLGLTNNLDALVINASYSDLTLIVPRNFNGDFTVNTSFGKAQGGTYVALNDATREKKYGPTFDRLYTGRAGNGKSMVVVNSSFGNVRFE